MRTNFHTHTCRCQHAQGKPEDYVKRAIRADYAALGIADHCPWPYSGGYASPIRMKMSELEPYCREVKAAAEKYSGRIEVYTGLECEFFKDYLSFLRELRDGSSGFQIDYLLLGHHHDRHEMSGVYFGDITDMTLAKHYTEQAVEGLGSGLYDCFAHPDVFLSMFPTFTDELRSMCRDLAQAAASFGVPVEYNLMGFRKQASRRITGGIGFPYLGFWEEAAKAKCKAIIGVDAHNPCDIDDVALYISAENTLRAVGVEQIYSIIKR